MRSIGKSVNLNWQVKRLEFSDNSKKSNRMIKKDRTGIIFDLSNKIHRKVVEGVSKGFTKLPGKC